MVVANVPAMTHATTLKFEVRQNQTLTPRLQYAVRLLQLSSLDYEHELHEVMGKNPFLETDESDADEHTLPEPWVNVNSAPGLDASTAPASNEPDTDAEIPVDRESWLQSPGSMRDGASESQTSAMDMMVADVGLREHLRSQANTLPLSPRDHALVCAVIESLDDDGYLRTELDEITTLIDLAPAPDACELNTALKLVQSFDPVGVGARGVSECLLLQLEGIEPALRDCAARILGEHLDRLAQRDTATLARLLDQTPAEIDAACAAIRRLDPHPGWRFGRSDAQYVVPDVVVRKHRGKWSAQLNPAVVPRLRLNQAYAEIFQRQRHAAHPELVTHLQEARWALRNVEQRFSTILAVAQSILKRQHAFFEYGPLAMKPLGLREVAEEVGVHESTVCRVTNNKYMSTPAGVLELKRFFSRAMPMASGKAFSATAIRSVVQELIAAEDPARPLSDVELAERLARQGLTVARRTVTKYRQMLQVPAVEQRRRIGAT
jgi:RNA polymerase sigma-54 factor